MSLLLLFKSSGGATPQAYNESPSDILVSSETKTSLIATSLTNSDTVISAETPTNTTLRVSALSDTSISTEVLTNIVSQINALSDVGISTETLTVNRNASATLSDTSTLTDSIDTIVGLVNSNNDSIGSQDSLISGFSLTTTLADTSTSIDAIESGFNLTTTLLDTSISVESLLVLKTSGVGVTDTVSSQEVLDSIATFEANVNDIGINVDNGTTTAIWNHNQIEATIVVADSNIGGFIFQEISAETTSSSDSFVNFVNGFNVLSDTLSIVEQLESQQVLNCLTNDLVQQTDSLISQKELAEQSVDIEPVLDSLLHTLRIEENDVNSINSVDSKSCLQNSFNLVADIAVTTDLALFLGDSFFHTTNDAVEFVDFTEFSVTKNDAINDIGVTQSSLTHTVFCVHLPSTTLTSLCNVLLRGDWNNIVSDITNTYSHCVEKLDRVEPIVPVLSTSKPLKRPEPKFNTMALLEEETDVAVEIDQITPLPSSISQPSKKPIIPPQSIPVNISWTSKK